MRALAAGCWPIALAAVVLAAGGPLRAERELAGTRQQQAALAQRNQELQSRATTLDQDNQELQTQLAQNQRQTRLWRTRSTASASNLAARRPN